MKKLLVLYLLIFSLSAEGQSKLKRFLADSNRSSIETLDLSRCDLASLPAELKDCLQIKELDLSKNELDSLPTWFGLFKDLEVLHLSSNQFKHLPQVLQQCQGPEWQVQLSNGVQC